ncbi:MAG: thioredoxin family protein [Pseudomonadota bacterium]
MDHPIVSQEEWLQARKVLLQKEKEETHLRDAVRAARQALPWVRVDEDYIFDTPSGKRSLSKLFDGRSQLIVYHFMLGPGWKAGCPGCSFLSDHIDGALPHLNHHDVTWTAVSRAPMNEIAAYKKRMGWKFPWASSAGSSFNHDFHVSFSKEELATGNVDYNFGRVPTDKANDELPGLSAFFKDKSGAIFHTYSSYARGAEEIIGTLMILDRTPLGRNEDSTMNFVRRHDEYDAAAE